MENIKNVTRSVCQAVRQGRGKQKTFRSINKRPRVEEYSSHSF